jgi:hypothetical protein
VANDMTRKYALQPEGYKVFFRCPPSKNSLVEAWSTSPLLASCYGDNYDTLTMLMLITRERAKKHGCGFVFDINLEDIQAMAVRRPYAKMYTRAQVRLNDDEDSLLFKSTTESLPPFLEYLVEKNYIRNTGSIDNFLNGF